MNQIREQIIWHKMRRLAATHPFFCRKQGLLSMREAKSLLRGREIPDGSEVLRQARTELGIPEPATNSDELRRQTHFAGLWLPVRLRRWAIGLAVFLAVLGFFTMTKPGIAFAKSIQDIIVRILDGSLLAYNDGPQSGGLVPMDFTALPAELESPEAVAEATGRQIIVPDEGDELLWFETHVAGETMLVMRSAYVRADGKQYTVVQSLNNDLSLWGTGNSTAGGIRTVKLDIGVTAYLSTMEDGTVYAEAFGSGYTVNLSSTELSADELLETVQGIQLIG